MNQIKRRMAELENKKVHWMYFDPKSNNSHQMQMTCSEHAIERMCERKITKVSLMLALEFGEVFFKQGLMFYVVPKKNIKRLSPQVQKALNNLVVLVNEDHSKILTVYRSKNGMKYLKKKSKQFYKNAA